MFAGNELERLQEIFMDFFSIHDLPHGVAS